MHLVSSLINKRDVTFDVSTLYIFLKNSSYDDDEKKGFDSLGGRPDFRIIFSALGDKPWKQLLGKEVPLIACKDPM